MLALGRLLGSGVGLLAGGTAAWAGRGGAKQGPRLPAAQGPAPCSCQGQPESGREIRDAIYITLEILSNWGHATRVGLTEVEFFDLQHRKVFVSPHDVDIRHADSPRDLGCLVNRHLHVSLAVLRLCPQTERRALGVCACVCLFNKIDRRPRRLVSSPPPSSLPG